jgi:hypothetical protein
MRPSGRTSPQGSGIEKIGQSGSERLRQRVNPYWVKTDIYVDFGSITGRRRVQSN